MGVADSGPIGFEITAADKSTSDSLNKYVSANISIEGKEVAVTLAITGDVAISDTEFGISSGLIKSTTKYDDKTYIVDLGFESAAKVTDGAELSHDYPNAVALQDVADEQLSEIAAAAEALKEQFDGMLSGFASRADALPESNDPNQHHVFGGNGGAESYKDMLEARGIDLTDPSLAEKFSEYGIDIGDYATYTDGTWTFDVGAIASGFSFTR
jgi:hypothetical protein